MNKINSNIYLFSDIKIFFSIYLGLTSKILMSTYITRTLVCTYMQVLCAHSKMYHEYTFLPCNTGCLKTWKISIPICGKHKINWICNDIMDHTKASYWKNNSMTSNHFIPFLEWADKVVFNVWRFLIITWEQIHHFL